MTVPADGRGPTAGSRDCRWTERTDITQVTGRREREPLGSTVKESDRWTWEGQQDAEHTRRGSSLSKSQRRQVLLATALRRRGPGLTVGDTFEPWFAISWLFDPSHSPFLICRMEMICLINCQD